MPSSQSRILKTFFGYLILILIPLTVLMYQGFSNLRISKRQIQNNVHATMRKVGQGFYADLERRWNSFLNGEKIRPFYHYHPWISPDGQRIVSDEAVQRSTLYQTVYQLNNLNQSNSLAGESSDQLSISLDQVITNSLVGYFQFDPHAWKMETPYFDPTDTFLVSKPEKKMVANFHNFLNDKLKPVLADRLDIATGTEIKPTNLWQRLKTKRLPLTTQIPLRWVPKYGTVYGGTTSSGKPSKIQLVNVKYYEFAFMKLIHEKVDYVICFRPVEVGPSIFIQGFVINQVRLITEAQSYLELYQPEYGNVVVGAFTSLNAIPMFPPFELLSIIFKDGDAAVYLNNYRIEMRRFWFTMVFLMVALIASLIHMGQLVSANARLDRKKNDFISAITHELKAPLTSIIMYAEMLEEGWAKGKEATYYSYIHSESERLSRLIKNILDYSGLERGVFRLKKDSLLLHSFIADTLDPLRVWVQNSGLQLNMEVLATPFVKIDKDSLSQIIFNLVDNAIKYGRPEEDGQLTILIDENQDQAEIYVFDNGPGVSRQEETKVFRRFYRCENELTRESTGTGLGLALVKELVEGNDGQISLYQPASKGFGVKILFPKVVIDSSLVSRQTRPTTNP